MSGNNLLPNKYSYWLFKAIVINYQNYLNIKLQFNQLEYLFDLPIVFYSKKN